MTETQRMTVWISGGRVDVCFGDYGERSFQIQKPRGQKHWAVVDLLGGSEVHLPESDDFLAVREKLLTLIMKEWRQILDMRISYGQDTI